MVDIDLKDRKILYQLDLNCRQSNSQIGKKVGLSKQVVDYRIKRMEEEGIITCYWTAIDTYTLGYQVFRIYINFKEISSDIKKEIITYFAENKNTWAVISSKGEIEFDVIFWVKNVNQFYSYWYKTMEMYGKYFSQNIISPLFQVVAFDKAYIKNEKEGKSKVIYRLNFSGNVIEIDRTDYQILDILVLDARISLVQLANKIGCSSQQIKYRIDALIRNNIIKAFRIAINNSKLGYQKFGLLIYLADPSMKKAIMDYIIDKPYMEYIDEGVGFSDILIEVIVEKFEKLLKIIDEMDKRFPRVIRKQTFLTISKYHKERWLPEMTEADFKKT